MVEMGKKGWTETMKAQKRIFISIIIITFVLAMAVAAVCERAAWVCPECGRAGNTGKFCGGCGYPAPEISTADGANIKEKTIVVGDIITFGRYEQDNNLENGPEKIEWIVLDYDETGNKALLLSRYGLDSILYNTANTSVTWEKSAIRKWLNEDFFNSAFNQKEQTALLMTEVDNNANQGYGKWETYGGNHTQDRVFLLSYTEANRYLDVTNDDRNNQKSRVAPTAYAIAHGALTGSYQTEDGAASGWWWLRSPGFVQSDAADVYRDGSLYSSRVDTDRGVVRPALWINFESDIF